MLVKWLKQKWHYPTGFILSVALFMWSHIFNDLNISYCFIGVLASFGIYGILEDINDIFIYRRLRKEAKERWAQYFSEYKDHENEC